MLSSITSSPQGLAGSGSATPAAEPGLPAAADQAASGAQNRAYRISLSAEAELSISIRQTTEISISQTGEAGAKSAAAPQDAKSERALSTLQAVAKAQREWIAKLKAEAEGKDPTKDQGPDASTTKAKASADSRPPSELPVTIQQETEVDVSLSGSAQVDVQA